jgi:hypothetical protein
MARSDWSSCANSLILLESIWKIEKSKRKVVNLVAVQLSRNKDIVLQKT